MPLLSSFYYFLVSSSIIHNQRHIFHRLSLLIFHGRIVFIPGRIFFFFLSPHHASTFISFINTRQQKSQKLISTCCTPPIHSTLSVSPTSLSVFPNPSWQPLLPHPPVRVFCCRITLCLLRFVLCSRPITTTGEVTGVGLPISCVVVNVEDLLQIQNRPPLAGGE